MGEAMVTVPKLVPLSHLKNLVPGTSDNFWFQRSRFNKIPGQFRCGRRIVIDIEKFFRALEAGEVEPLSLAG